MLISLIQAKILNKVEKLETKSNLYLFTYFYLLISSANLQPIMILITLMGIVVNRSFLFQFGQNQTARNRNQFQFQN